MLKRSLKRPKSGQNVSTMQTGDVQDDLLMSRVILGQKPEKDEEEKVLEKVVLGGDDDILDHLQKSDSKKAKTSKINEENKTEPAPAWDDDDAEDDDADDKIKISEKDFRHRYFKHGDTTEISRDTYKQTLKSQFEKVTGQPSWAKLRWQRSDDEDGDSEDDLETKQMLQSTGDYLSSTQGLEAGILQVKQCQDGNKEQPAQCKLLAMEFHPSAQVMLAGGSNQTLALFQVDGKHNAKIQSIYLDRYPILCAHFSTDGQEVIISSRHSNFKYYDMIAGKVIDVPKIKGLEGHPIKQFITSPDGKYLAFIGQYGCVHLISAKSKEWIFTLKMNGEVEALAFTSDGSKMLSHGEGGEVYVWDMSTRDCVHRFHDDGCLRGTSLAVANGGRYIAAGSQSGVVNLYDERCLIETHPKPLRAIMNLTSPCTKVVFNSTTEILAMASSEAAQAIRLMHIPSQTVFSNFPDRADYIKVPQTVDFSLNSGYLAIGNNKGRALLFRLKHYSDY